MPVIALTANAMKGEEQRCLAHGMDAYLSKPIELTRLKALLNEWLSTDLPVDSSGDSRPPEKEAAAASAGQAVFDAGALKKIVGGKLEYQQRLLGKFMVNGREHADKLDSACAARNLASVGQVAHSLKSAARVVGAMRLGQICEALELAARAESTDDVAALHAELLTTVELTFQTIQTHLHPQSA